MSFKRARRPTGGDGGGEANGGDGGGEANGGDSGDGGDSVRRAGVRMSPSGVAMTSSGTAGVDAAVGGGLPLGSLTMLVEDAPTAHHDALVRLFLAQGLAHGHAVALAQQHAPPADSLAALPAAGGFAAPRGAAAAGGGAAAGGALNIAWRYAEAGRAAAGARATGASAAAAMYRHAFDLSEEVAPPEHAPVSHLGLGRSEQLSVLVEDVRAHVRSANKRGLIARVAVCGLSPDLWEVDTGCLSAFLHDFRVIAQRADAIALVTVPLYVVSMKLVREVDIAIGLDTFEGKGAGEAGLGSEWLGVLRIDKRFARPGLITLAGRREDLWVFKRGRRKYVFEVAAAAPDEEESKRNPQEVDSQQSPGGAGSLCQSGPQQNSFEF